VTGPLRTGLLGFGLAGRVFHAPLIDADADFELTYIVTSDPVRQEQARRAHPGASILTSPEELWSVAPDLDVIVVASPPTAHREQGLRALESGCAVVVDKPFALTTADADELIAAADRSPRPLVVFQNRRWDGDFLTVRHLLDEGRLGQVHSFTSSFEREWPLPDGHWRTGGSAAGAGILFDIGAHLIDQALELFGEADEVTAELHVVHPHGTSDDSAFVSLLHRSGVRSHLSMSRVAQLGAPRFQVLGSAGAYRVDGIDGQEEQLAAGIRPSDAGYGVTAADGWGTLSVDGSAARLPTHDGRYPDFYAGIADALFRGGNPPVSAGAARRTLRIIEHLYRTVPLQRLGSA
jgi:predicted dehydrogenase